MATLYPVSGCKFYIGTVAMDAPDDDLDASDFSAVVWTQVKGWSQMGGFGDASQLITTPIIDRNRDVKQKGTRNAGSMQNVFAAINDDAGQVAIIAAEVGEDNWPFRIELNDKVSGGSTNSFRYFVGLVTTAQEAGGNANTVQNLNVTVEVNSNIVSVART